MNIFKEYPKTSRLYGPVCLTEKLDGTNAAIIIDDLGETLYAQSRNKVITPTDDNAGFAKWVEKNKATLLTDLGPGDHFGEWYGSGIGRGYGLKDKFFALFNTRQFSGATFATPNLQVVPILYEGVFSEKAVEDACADLKANGSKAVPGFMRPEGVVVSWSHDCSIKKVPFDK